MECDPKSSTRSGPPSGLSGSSSPPTRASWALFGTSCFQIPTRNESRGPARRGVHFEAVLRSPRTLAEPAGHLAETEQDLFVLVPHLETHRFQAAPEGKRVGQLKLGGLVEAPLQVVVGYPWPQVVDVVKADIAGNPLEHFRQLVVRGTLHRG